jgi:type I restriction enzyme, S subunit
LTQTMPINAEVLFRHFERISEAPDAVPRLRRFILDLAVRGKLVEQDSAEEPASELLKRIEAEKARKDEGLQNQQSKPLDGEQVPFSIPTNWVWTQLAQIGFINPRNNAEDSAKVSFVPMPMIFTEYSQANQHEVRTWGEIKKSFTHFMEGDIGLAKITPCFENGKSTIFRNLMGGLGAGTTELHVVRPILVAPEYILIFLKSQHFIQTGIPKMTGTAGQKRVPKDYFAFSPFPLPPIPEQRRIVAKVDELIALCNELEAAQTKREKRRDRLVAAALHKLSDGNASQVSETSPTFKENVRFYFNHLPRLTTRPEHIHQLRHTILTLAVRGKLVPQNSNDEPASKLLNRIDQERSFLAKKDRRSDAEAQELLAVDFCWEVPPTWEWRGLADLVLFIDYRGKTPAKVATGIRLITAKNVRRGIINLEPEEFITEATYNEWMTRGLPRKGDILFTTEAPMGNAAVVQFNERFGLAQRVINFRPYSGLNSDFLALQLLSGPFQAILNKTATGLTAKGIKAAKLKRLPITVPPLAEQNRIVGKLNELMALCDDMEARLTTNTNARCQLLEVTLHEILFDKQKSLQKALKK